MGIKNRGFHRGFKQGIMEIKGFGFRKCPQDFLSFFYTPRGRDSSYFGLFSSLRAVWVCFFCLKGLFGKTFGLWECCPVLAL